MRVFESVAELKEAVGEDLGTSSWLTITPERVQSFADATGDRQWIHLDEERAATSPFGGTIVHGFLTLALIAEFKPDVFEVRGAQMVVNYGVNRVRFTSPVRVGSEMRARVKLTDLKEIQGGVQLGATYTMEVRGQEKPACIAEHVTRIYF